MRFQNFSSVETTSLPFHNLQTISFFWYDYLLFSIVLGFSSLIGIFFGCYHKQNTKKEYLLGGKQMKVWPIAISLIARWVRYFSTLTIIEISFLWLIIILWKFAEKDFVDVLQIDYIIRPIHCFHARNNSISHIFSIKYLKLKNEEWSDIQSNIV